MRDGINGLSRRVAPRSESPSTEFPGNPIPTCEELADGIERCLPLVLRAFNAEYGSMRGHFPKPNVILTR